jgi:hypothetical protein
MRRAAVCAVLLLGACVRAGFGPDGAHGDAPGAGRAKDHRGQKDDEKQTKDQARHERRGLEVSAGPVLGKLNDSCASPLLVDMAGTSQVTIKMDFTGATSDQNILCCLGAPDLVLRVTNAPQMITLSCTGGGQIYIAHDPTCPSTLKSCFSGSCGAGNSLRLPIDGAEYFVLCRPSGAGPADLIIVDH